MWSETHPRRTAGWHGQDGSITVQVGQFQPRSAIVLLIKVSTTSGTCFLVFHQSAHLDCLAWHTQKARAQANSVLTAGYLAVTHLRKEWFGSRRFFPAAIKPTQPRSPPCLFSTDPSFVPPWPVYRSWPACRPSPKTGPAYMSALTAAAVHWPRPA